jgi:asparagine synthase (glutamine-hydrolysing)
MKEGMCGIAGMIDLEGRHRAEAWALRHIRHRGPDGEGVMVSDDGNVVLEHCRLAIIDPENADADQPFSDPSGRWTIVYNGEIFNYREIRSDLERKGVSFSTRSDTEVLLLGFIHERERILQRLRGMFAFVVYDRVTQDLFAARDQLGVKPFYYSVQDGVLSICSEMRPLLVRPGFRRSLDPSGVVEFLAFGNSFGDRTLVEDVQKLLPGHALRIRDRRVEVQEYWDAIPPANARNGQPLAGELLGVLDDAVGAALVSDVPVGLMLSGGIDSSAIATLAARRVPPSELTAYSVDFDQPNDEAVAAGKLACDLGLEHRVIRLSEDDLERQFDKWLGQLDYPCGNPTWIANSMIASAARADGIKVLLSGDGGDELFGGYDRWMKYLRFHDVVWRRLPARARQAGGQVTRRWGRGLAGDIARRAIAGGDLFVPSRPTHDDVLATTLGPIGLEAARAAAPEAHVEDLRRRFDERMPRGDYLAWMSYVTLKTKLVEDYLQRLDKMGMRHSVEGRVPLLDPRLVQWAFGVSQREKVPGLRQKALFRAALEPVLPPYVLERGKQGFCAPVAAWTERLLLRRPTADGPLVAGGVISADALAIARTSTSAFASWTLAILSDWTERNVSAAPARPAMVER